jgi:hypothetical protein
MSKIDARFINEIPQSERREIARNDQSQHQPSTMAEWSQLNETRGGRFAPKKPAMPDLIYPPQPENPWAADLANTEPFIDGTTCGDRYIDPSAAMSSVPTHDEPNFVTVENSPPTGTEDPQDGTNPAGQFSDGDAVALTPTTAPPSSREPDHASPLCVTAGGY